MSSAVATPTPALPPPPGATSNFDHPDDDLARAGRILYTLYLVFASAAFWIRCYVQLRVHRKWLVEDFCLSVAYAGLVVFCILTQIMVSRGGGIHGWDLTPQQVEDAIYWYSHSSVVYSVVACGAKMCLLLFYYRLFSTKEPSKYGIVWGRPEGPMHVVIIAVMLVVVGFYIPTVFIKAFQCFPLERIWRKDTPGSCINLASLLNSSGFINTLTDLLILVIPIRGVWKLKKSIKRRLQILPIFLFGALAPAVAAKGVTTRFQVSGSTDYSWTLPEISIWAGAEIAVGIVCASAPTFRALRPSFRRRRRHSHPPTWREQWYRPNAGYIFSHNGRTLDDDDEADVGRSFSQWGYGIGVTTGVTVTAEVREKPDVSAHDGSARYLLAAPHHAAVDKDARGTDSDGWTTSAGVSPPRHVEDAPARV